MDCLSLSLIKLPGPFHETLCNMKLNKLTLFTYQIGAFIVNTRVPASSKCCCGISLAPFGVEKTTIQVLLSLTALLLPLSFRAMTVRYVISSVVLSWELGQVYSHGQKIKRVWWKETEHRWCDGYLRSIHQFSVFFPHQKEASMGQTFHCSCLHVIPSTDPTHNILTKSLSEVTYSCFKLHSVFTFRSCVLSINIMHLHGIKYLSMARWNICQLSVSNWCVPITNRFKIL